MHRSCPSCGSAVEPGITICPVCGDALAPDGESASVSTAAAETQPTASEIPATPVTLVQAAQAGVPAGTQAPAPAPAQAPANGKSKGIYCPACGVLNIPGAAFCSACGSRIGAPPKRAAAAAPRPGAGNGRKARMDYVYAAIVALVIAGVVFLVATPEEHTGPPQTAAQQAQAGADGANTTNGAMPPGHPPTGQSQAPTATPEQLQEIATLEAQVKATPDDLDSKLKLANIYYDLERHAEAVPLYRDYLVKHPENADARTDMAYSIANTGDVETAITQLRDVISKNPKHQNAAYNLATMYLAKRNRDSTFYWLKRVVEIDSTTQPGRLAAQILGQVQQAHPPLGDSATGRQ